jgi:hypothetical protein
MKLKIGDKVRITKYAEWCGLVGEVCIVCRIEDLDSQFICRIQHTSSNWDCLMFEKEIEKVAHKNQQLLFSFME